MFKERKKKLTECLAPIKIKNTDVRVRQYIKDELVEKYFSLLFPLKTINSRT